MKRRNWMGFANEQVKKGKLHTSPGLLKRIAQRARAAAGEARAATKRAKEKENEASRYYKELQSRVPRGGYKWPSTKRTKAGKTDGRSLTEMLLGRNPDMPKKRKKRKKAMPAGLKAYWAKKRAAKNGRRKKRRKTVKRAKRAAVRNYRKRRTAKRRKATRNPVSRLSRITLPAMSPAATKKTIALIKRLAGNRRVRVK